MKRLIPLFISITLPIILNGQNQVDALRYTQTFNSGTARSVGMGGAFGALGGDFSSISQNPAGLGVYRGSEFTFTPELYYNLSTSRYLNNTEEDYKYDFRFGNLGYVTSFDFKNEKGLISGSFGIGYNKLNHYGENIFISGINRNSSLADDFTWTANDRGPADLQDLEPFSEGLFYDGGIIELDGEGFYGITPAMLDTLGNVNIEQKNSIYRTGIMNDWVVAFALNFNHKFYFGASLDIIPVEFTERSAFKESSALNGSEYYTYNESLTASGTGFGAKIGFIVKPVTQLRLGLAYHSPIAYRISEVYDADLYSNIDGFEDYYKPVDAEGYLIDYGSSDYQVMTPARGIASLGLILGKFAILSSDLEYIRYSRVRLNNASDGYDFDIENDDIRRIYKDNFNLKTGLEIRAGMVYLRGGFGYYGSPFKDSEANANAYKLSYNGGIGLRSEKFFINFAFAYLDGRDEMNILYYSEFIDPSYETALINTDKLRTMMTFGFRF